MFTDTDEGIGEGAREEMEVGTSHKEAGRPHQRTASKGWENATTNIAANDDDFSIVYEFVNN